MSVYFECIKVKVKVE